MRTGIVLAWLTAMGIITYRDIRVNHGPPIPGQLLGASGLFVLLALLAEAPNAAPVAAALGWGFDLAALLNILPQGFGGPQPKAGTARSSTPPSGLRGPNVPQG